MNAPRTLTIAPGSTRTTLAYLSLKTPEGQTVLFEEPHECPICGHMTSWFICLKTGQNYCWLCRKDLKR